ncbi:hypothetical protein Agabi119p4_1854 [Agaricus bisporus var. burnettii]|uniref:Uncharacterized protein n=1 Tax=Agaricus bisporus var. burnettii TaxID=192524 RepID=A0A8H7KJQ4_AGABI|nr:hypothetical protein Agabi119p4_1854 [Agaricus bisporus var. burnettii]
MSLLASRAVRVARTRLAHRNASTNHAGEHTNYPKEDFVTPFWRNALIAAGLVVAAYKYAPEPGKDVYLTRWIAMYTTPVGEWLKRSVSRAAAQEVEAENTRLMMSARRPLVHRYRYPQSFEQASPFVIGVGSQVQLDDVVVKRE